MKNVIRIIAGLIFFVLLLFFIAPVTVKILCAGNLAGMAISLAGILICLFYGKFSRLVSHICERLPGRIFISALGGLACIGAVTSIVLSCLMLREMNDRPKGDTTLVVLGCQVRSDGPSLMLKRRLDAAYDYLSDHEGVCAVLSGGQGEDEVVSEAECMYDYLINRGISSDRLYMEDKSTTTKENIGFSMKLIEREGLCSDITIVTDGFHQYRADMFAKRQGIDSCNIAAATPVWLLPTYWVREWFGILYYGLFG